ncbi:MAG: glycerate kinase [Victivallaceae bacterium]|nr:glycerate kinase [Victivallaceae bacterium]
MKKIVIAPDSYKGCLPADEVAEAVAAGLRKVFPAAELVLLPLADGGEGTLQALLRLPGAEAVEIQSRDAFMRPLRARVAKLPGGRFAVELAEICGIERHKDELSPLRATSYGVGLAILSAASFGATEIVVSLGGSCSTDGGAGILQALGAVFRDEAGNKLPPGLGGGGLARIATVELTGIPELNIVVATDVTSPLCGESGAARVFAPQKGATPDEVRMLDADLRRFAELCGRDGSSPGDGAAGGCGFALRAVCGGRTTSGATMVMDMLGFGEALDGADWLITGEGCSDAQTLAGKLCFQAAEAARKRKVKTALISGALRDRERLDGFFDLTAAASPADVPLDEAIRNAATYIEKAAESLFRR